MLFIDEIHTIVGAGSADGALGASDMLKPMLARGELQTIGATTTDEYRKYIEKDAALERRFQPIQVHEPTIAETIEILKGLRSRYENHHHVTITDGALQSAAELSSRYIQDRNLPDKAIDLIDEACPPRPSSRNLTRRSRRSPPRRTRPSRTRTSRRPPSCATTRRSWKRSARRRNPPGARASPMSRWS